MLQMLNLDIAFVHQEKTAGVNIKRSEPLESQLRRLYIYQNGYTILYDQYLMHWQMTNFYRNAFMVRLRTRMRYLTTLFGQDVLRSFTLVGQ